MRHAPELINYYAKDKSTGSGNYCPFQWTLFIYSLKAECGMGTEMGTAELLLGSF